MRSAVLLSLVIHIANPLSMKTLATKVSPKHADSLENDPIAFALDLSIVPAQNMWKCLITQHYSTVFARVYKPDGDGAYDPIGGSNIKMAFAMGFGAEMYMSPQPSSSKSAGDQVDEIYQGLLTIPVIPESLWIQVTSPINWPNSPTVNRNFIAALVKRAWQYGWTPGIYTNSYEWNQITGGWTDLIGGSLPNLWYWSVKGNGSSGETPQNFNDFRPFGPWNSPDVKQFAQDVSVCSTPVNRDIYYGYLDIVQRSAVMRDGKIVVGTSNRRRQPIKTDEVN